MPTMPIDANLTGLFKTSTHSLADKKNQRKLALEDLIAYEQAHPDERVELVDGQIITMGGTTGKHNLIANVIWAKIDTHFLSVNAKCFCYTADIRVRISKYQYRYPDFVVDCSGKMVELYAENPVLVGEVLSETSTGKFDKTEKLDEYKSVTAIQEIVLVAQDKKQVTVHRRKGLIFDSWTVQTYEQGDVELQSIGLTIPIEDIYRRIDFDD